MSTVGPGTPVVGIQRDLRSGHSEVVRWLISSGR